MRALLSLTLAAIAAAVVRADLDLTPRFALTGGGKLRRAYFQDGEKQFAVSLDAETTVAADDKGAVFRFEGIPQASLALRKSPMAKTPPPFGPETMPEYAKAAAELLPPAAEAVVADAPVMDVLPVNRWKSCRFVYQYKVGGAGYTESVTFLTLETGQQIVIQAGSRARDFAAVAARADDILRRWHEVLPGDEAGAN